MHPPILVCGVRRHLAGAGRLPRDRGPGARRHPRERVAALDEPRRPLQGDGERHSRDRVTGAVHHFHRDGTAAQSLGIGAFHRRARRRLAGRLIPYPGRLRHDLGVPALNDRHLSRPLVPIAPEVILHDDADRRMGGGIRVAVPVKDPCHTPGVLIGGKHRGGAYHIVAQFPRFDAVVLVARSVQPRDTDVIFHIVVWKRHVISFVGGRQRRGIRRIRRAEHHSHPYYQTGQHRYDGHAPLPPCRYHHSSFPGTFPRILHCVRVGHDHGRFSFATAGFSTYVVRACRLPASCG